MSRRLLMWDIDLTLLHTRGITRAAYGAAFQSLAGFEPEVYPDFAGRTDLDAATEVFARHGITEPDLDGFFALYAAELLDRAHLIPGLGVLLPGAREVLTALAGRPDLVQTTVTGNIPPVARAKLVAFGLDGMLDLAVGGFGDQDTVRANLVAASRRRAEEKYGRFAEVLVIGDTVHDVAAALACEVTAIGVASGRTGAEQLWAAGAHAVLDSLADTAEVVAVLTDGNRRGAVRSGDGTCQDSSCPPHPSRPAMAPSPPPT
jgi:phosphoglycolate phosphatase-like HAD superfamily hydrolase